MNEYITGIQQIGIGVTDARHAMLMYKQLFGMDVLIFDDVAEAALMTQYTGGTLQKRRAVLSLNMHGGGGFELWQFLSRMPGSPAKNILYGDLGIFAARIKCADIIRTHQQFQNDTTIQVSTIHKDPAGKPHFWLKDVYNNYFNIVPADDWFKEVGKGTGGVYGAVIGVKDMDKSLVFYKDVLGIQEIVFDETDTFTDNPSGKPEKYRRVLLRKQVGNKGAFHKLLGGVEIELVQCLERKTVKIYADRYWGDLGFIHLCFDVLDMDGLKGHAEIQGHSFAVDSQASFAMENAAGRFCYIEDPDGTLIELVETHKVPIVKKIGWYLNLKKRSIQKPLPDFMIKLLAISKVK